VAHAQSLTAQYAKMIVGKWQSMDDPKSFEIFTDKALAISEYGGKKLMTEHYRVSYNEHDKSYLLSRSEPKSDADAMVYSIIKMDNNIMELSLLSGRGNTLRYKKVGGTSANNVSTGKLLTVAAAKAYFHNAPNPKTARKAYLISGQQVSVSKEQNGFASATYVNDKGVKTTGWLKRSDLK
jgi:hypothetical protein